MPLFFFNELGHMSSVVGNVLFCFVGATAFISPSGTIEGSCTLGLLSWHGETEAPGGWLRARADTQAF